MKKLAIVAAALVLAAAPAFSQVIPGAGYVNSTLTANGNNSVLNGFYVGVSMDMDLFGVKGLTLAPGVYASAIFSSSSVSLFGIISSTGKNTEIDLNIPVYFKFSYNLNRDARVFAYAGPTAQIGLIARSNSQTTFDIGSTSSTRDLFSGDTGLNRFNILVGGGIGFGYSKFSINVGYDYGLLNVYRGGRDTMMNRANLHVGISYAL